MAKKCNKKNSNNSQKKTDKNSNYTAKKKYGQNFLEDSYLLEKIIDITGICKKTEVIEIGPGFGFLTGRLIEEAQYLTAFEIDNDLIPILMERFGDNEKFTLIHEDFLTADLEKYIKNEKGIKVVANIPYYITSPIINKLIEYRKNISEIYLMVQKEVAERIASKPGSRNMGLLTHAVQFHAETEYLFTVPKEKFNPMPKVDSAFIKIEILNPGIYENQISEEEYFRYLKAAFSSKRKSIVNNLMVLGYSKDRIGEALEKLGKVRLMRAEEFSVQEFIDFIKILKEND